MESLALAAAVIVIVIVVLGSLSFVVAWRNPDRSWSRLLGMLVSIPTMAAGAWLALLDVGSGARLVGAVVFVAGVAAFLRSARRG